ncbi:centromere protein X isoform X1 [Lagopus leucura]|uniref:centromere protein X isoform X1 n=1 Tax=Lagopus leucura TaxID=30410 RepID=UPI001C6833EA|nr:centromere protein X isoform X1 [Lagopus leucura]
MEEREGCFRKETVERLLRLHFRDGRTRVNGDALLLMAELLTVFVREAAARAARQAQAEDLEKVDIEHVEKVLPQLRCAHQHGKAAVAFSANVRNRCFFRR